LFLGAKRRVFTTGDEIRRYLAQPLAQDKTTQIPVATFR